MKIITLIGSSHYPENYSWLRKQLTKLNPDAITLEQSIGLAGVIKWDFKKELDELESNHSTQNILSCEFSAGVHHGRKENNTYLLHR